MEGRSWKGREESVKLIQRHSNTAKRVMLLPREVDRSPNIRLRGCGWAPRQMVDVASQKVLFRFKTAMSNVAIGFLV